jgi:hypothetical protein
MQIKKIATTAAVAAGLGAAALGLGTGTAQADDGWYWPGHGDWFDVPGNGPTGWGAPGQLKKLCPPACDTPPGHWVAGPQGPPIPAPWVPWP